MTKSYLWKRRNQRVGVSAFANTFGGALIFGIADNDEIVGLENQNSDAEKISEIIKTRMDPIP